MRLAIDARELQGQPTGVGRLLTSLLEAWADMPAAVAAHEFVLCAPEPIAPAALQRLRHATAAVDGRHHGTAWEQFTLPRLVRHYGADLLFPPAYTSPVFCPVPVVVAIHDVSFAAHPEWFGWREGWRRRTLARLSARRAQRVLTISQFSKAEIVKRLGIEGAKIDVVYPGVSTMHAGRAFTARPADRHPSTSLGMTLSLSKGQGPPRSQENLVLYVGSLFTRRHIPELITAFARLSRERANLRLEIVGDNRTTPRVHFTQLAASAGAGDRINIRSYVPDEELASLYADARAFVFLSEYEGFGLTPLEALAAGVPIVVLDTPVAREIYGAAALYVSRPDPDVIHAALSRVAG